MSSAQFRLAYCSNIWTHHQSPICLELVRLLGEDRFAMCLFEAVHEERRNLGWAGAVPDDPWIVGPPNTDGDIQRLRQIVCDADVAVLGACPQQIQAERVATGKLTFIMGERLMRKGHFRLRMLNPRFAWGIRWLRSTANRPNVHYLAIGAHAGADARTIGVFGDRMWKWGYFVPPTDRPFHERRPTSVRILWAGRYIFWKRVDTIVRAIATLGPLGDKCVLELIGAGPTRGSIERLAQRLGVSRRVLFGDPVAPEIVRQRMAEADIYVLPSNHLEGWGAVVGEAMCEGCVVVANKMAGASRTLIEHGRTGFLFADGDVRGLGDILRSLIVDVDKRRDVGRAAATHMQQLWHPRIGAERLVALCRGLLGLAPEVHYTTGPGCRVEVASCQ